MSEIQDDFNQSLSIKNNKTSNIYIFIKFTIVFI